MHPINLILHIYIYNQLVLESRFSCLAYRNIVISVALINGYKEFSFSLSILTKQAIIWSWFSFNFVTLKIWRIFPKSSQFFFVGKSQKNTEYVQKFSNNLFFFDYE